MNKKLLSNAKILRKNMTKEERHLWYDFLRQYPIKIYRQKVIEPYIVDFYCKAAKLVIELDGGQHYEADQKEYDAARTNYLAQKGLVVLRVSNLDIARNFYGVCEHIDKMITERTAM